MKFISALTIVVGTIIMLTVPLYFVPAIAIENVDNSSLSSRIFQACVPLAWSHFLAGFVVLLLGIYVGRDKPKVKENIKGE